LPTKILVVDDSATMRKILEMTFAGEDAEVVTVADGQAAIGMAADVVPDVVFADVSMPGVDAYGVSHAVKNNASLAKTAVIALASQHHPYDEAKGQSSGVDAHVMKPFDTQALIDLTAQVLRAPRALAEGAPPPSAAPAMPRAATQTANVAPPPPAGGAGAPQGPDAARQLRRTASFGEPPPLRPPAAKPVLELADEPDIEVDAPEPEVKPAAAAMPRAAAPASMPAAKPMAPAAAPAKPSFPAAGAPALAAAKPAAPAAPAPAAPAPSAAVAAATSGLEQKLAGLNLTKDQVSAVLALSREVIEQVVWEVVPDLAEALIKEEIARLTR
jgi:CheY-like chemotaxis protein